jgi:hypothetical protein
MKFFLKILVLVVHTFGGIWILTHLHYGTTPFLYPLLGSWKLFSIMTAYSLLGLLLLFRFIIRPLYKQTIYFDALRIFKLIFISSVIFAFLLINVVIELTGLQEKSHPESSIFTD